MSQDIYLLPNHPCLTSPDHLGICKDGEDVVNHYTLLKALLKTASDAFESLELVMQHGSGTAGDLSAYWCSKYTTLLKDIAYSLHGDDNLTTTGLEIFLGMVSNMSMEKLITFRSSLFGNALGLDSAYPEGILEHLGASCTPVAIEPRTVDVILAHMLLGTLSTPDGNTWGQPDFCELYAHSSDIAHAYVSTLLEHFAGGGYSALRTSKAITFSLHDAASMPNVARSEIPATSLTIRVVDEISEDASQHRAAGRFVLVASHSAVQDSIGWRNSAAFRDACAPSDSRQPGPGPNGTQEERLVGQSPALALLSLLKPVLYADEVIFTPGLWTHSSWTGHGRHAKMTRLFDHDERPLTRYIVADALELDVVDREDDTLPDLQAGNVEREVRKLYAAFSGAREVWSKEKRLSDWAESSKDNFKVELPPWGCGAFGGNLTIKAKCMMMAAALAGLESRHVELVVTRDRAKELCNISSDHSTVKDMYARLLVGNM